MFTVFVEAAQPDGDWNILQSYASRSLIFGPAKRLPPSQTEEHPEEVRTAAAIHSTDLRDDELATAFPGPPVWPHPAR